MSFMAAKEFVTRMGDGRRVFMTKQQIMDDIQAGMADGADAATAAELSDDEMERIYDVVSDTSKIVGVEQGEEVIMTKDGGEIKFSQDSGGSGIGITSIPRSAAILMYERAFAFDTMELGWMDYSLKPVKPLISEEMITYEQISQETTFPLLYGAMPNMGLYYAPDGPYGNPADLMREFKIEEAMDQAEKAADLLTRDIGYVTEHLDQVGLEGFDFDTTASAGDAEFVAALRGAENYRKLNPNSYINIGMSAENVLGIHGSIEYKGKAVAGMYPAEQAKMVEACGANMFGAVVNTNTSRSFAWNVARSAAIIKKCVNETSIPVHANLGMGVGGIPMCELVPTDTVGRAGKILIEIAHIDGI